MKQKATKLDVGAPKLSRQRRAPTRTEEFFGRQSAPDYDIDVISNYYRTSFETLDCIINPTADRYDQADFRIYVKLKNLLLKAAKGDVFIQAYNDNMAIYSSDFDKNRFQAQIKALQEYCTDLDGNTCICSITNTLQNLKVQSHFQEVCKLTKIILVLPERKMPRGRKNSVC